MRQMKHDMSNHGIIIRYLSHEKYYDDLEKYVESVFTEVDEVENIYTLQDHALSYILSVLTEQAREKDITFNTMIAVNNFYISSHDICAIVSNIVKNAIEATEHLDKVF